MTPNMIQAIAADRISEAHTHAAAARLARDARQARRRARRQARQATWTQRIRPVPRQAHTG